MERRNRSVEALERLRYINSLDDDDLRAHSLELWSEQYLDPDFANNISLSQSQLEEFSELFFQNIKFLKQHRKIIGEQIDEFNKIKKFFQ